MICCCCGSRKRKRKGVSKEHFGGRGDDNDDNDDGDESRDTYPPLEVDVTSLTSGKVTLRGILRPLMISAPDIDPTTRQRRSQAFKARLAQNPSHFALKPLYDQAGAADSRKVRALVAKQVQVSGAMDDPRILLPLGLTTVDGVLHLVSPWYELGNLRQHLSQDLDTAAREAVVSPRLRFSIAYPH